MIFNVADHVEQIVNGVKTQTRRDSDRYEVGKTYAIQPFRTAKADSRGRILITHKWLETWFDHIHPVDAYAEGCYTVREYEALYEKLHPRWDERWAYEFEFIPSEGKTK
jgi:hypothetical protein